MGNALTWCRNQGVNVTDDDASVPDFTKPGFASASARSPEDRLSDINSILNWIRSGSKPDDDSISDEVRRINQMLPVKKGQSPESRARDIESALDWMRSNDMPTTFEDQPDKFDKLGSLPIARRSPEDRMKEREDIANWIRQSKSPSADTPDGTFKKIDQMLPVKKGQSPESRASDIENALTWCRNQGVNVTDDDASVPDFTKPGFAS